MSDKNYQELYLKARKIYETATVAYKELIAHSDVLEKDQLIAAKVAIEKAKKTCLALQKKAKDSAETANKSVVDPEVIHVRYLEQIAYYLSKIFKIEKITKPSDVISNVEKALKHPTHEFTELAFLKLYQALNHLNPSSLKKLGSTARNLKLPKNTTINRRTCEIWADPNIRKELLRLIKPAYAKLKKVTDGIQEKIRNLPFPNGENLIKALEKIVSDKGGGHAFTDTFLQKTKADKSAAEGYIEEMCVNFDISKRAKLSKEIEKYANIIYQKSVHYITTRNAADKMGGNALKLLEQFFATAGVEDMSKWTAKKTGSKYTKILILRDAL